ncbi:MAG: cell division protein FtsZ, partial [Promethearchaeota archaeon]
ILRTGGVAIIGIGESYGKENRVEESINDALNLPLLDVDIDGAKGALIHVCGGNDMTLAEANSVAKKIYEKMDVNNSMVIWGARVSDEFNGYLRVMLLITGISSPQIFGNDPGDMPVYSPENRKSKIGLSDDIFDISEINFE